MRPAFQVSNNYFNLVPIQISAMHVVNPTKPIFHVHLVYAVAS